MLEIEVRLEEAFDTTTKKFVATRTHKLVLEHSLVSLSKWEQKHEVPFLDKKAKTPEQTVDYIKLMVTNGDCPDEVFNSMSEQDVDKIKNYIQTKASATFFPEAGGSGSAPPNRELYTAELIYYWMTAYNIDWQAQYWHLNRLFALIRIASIKTAAANGQKGKGRPSMTGQDRASLNAKRRAELGTTG